MFQRPALAIGLLLLPSTALAHIQLQSPTPRYADQKNGPCGSVNDARTNNVTVFEPGATITVTWRETINHPGHYRISFDADGQDDFVDPASYTDLYTNASVILDDIADSATPQMVYSVNITLPNIECENCTLQVVQVMTDKPPYVPGTNDLYYQCADLALRSAGTDAGVADSGPADTGIIMDSGSSVDAGPPDFGVDAAVDPDAGFAPDGGVSPDAGPPFDSGVADGGGSPDAGTADGGFLVPDSGTPGADAGEVDLGNDIEGGCSVSAVEASWQGLLVALIGFLLLRRRRR